jgi:hypothetical protein
MENRIGTELSYAAQNNVKQDADIKLAMDIANAQYRMFDSSQMDENTNSCMMDWILLALSPVGMLFYRKTLFNFTHAPL